MSGDRLLGLDVGTQSVRALLFDARGELIAGHRVPIEPYQPGEPAAAEQPAGLYWDGNPPENQCDSEVEFSTLDPGEYSA